MNAVLAMVGVNRCAEIQKVLIHVTVTQASLLRMPPRAVTATHFNTVKKSHARVLALVQQLVNAVRKATQ